MGLWSRPWCDWPWILIMLYKTMRICSQGWGWSFVVPGIIMLVLAVLIFLFLVVTPSDVGVSNPQEGNSKDTVSGLVTKA
jgi:sugar phosphate permease